MIHGLHCIVQAKRKQAIIVALGPILLELSVADESQFDLNATYSLVTYLHWNQEQGPQLYGFKNEADKAVFLLIIGCSGIGPRIGLAILADLGASVFIRAIQNGDDRILSKVNGIGTKKAEQMIVQLKHKINDFLSSGIAIESLETQIDWQTVSDALRALNYSRTEIAQAIAFVRDKNRDVTPSFDQVLRQTLSFLSKQQ
jgi:Holliday junction DNA helicase RuvA